jgi:phosphopantetheinyl transferase (holo-ACP synthase)
VAESGLSVGVDAVELDRIACLAGPGESNPFGRLYDRVAAAGERELAAAVDAAFGLPAAGAAALLAVKEAAVKAAGGRPPRFTWRDVVCMADLPDLPPDAAAVLASFEDDVLPGVVDTFGVRLGGAWGGASATAARFGAARLGAARFGLHADHLFAVVVLWAPASVSFCPPSCASSLTTLDLNR